MSKQLYDKAAKSAYRNCIDLLQEAVILYKHDRFARSYALSVLSCEEFAKAFLYKCIACGFVVDKDSRRDLERHELKLAHLAHIFSMREALMSISDEIEKARQHDKKYRYHRRHVLPKVYDKLGKISAMPLINILKLSHYYKILALYVDIKKGKLHEPSFMKKEPCHSFLHIVDHFVTGFDIILREKPERFRKTVEILDPDILKTGKIKFDFMPKGRFAFTRSDTEGGLGN